MEEAFRLYDWRRFIQGESFDAIKNFRKGILQPIGLDVNVYAIWIALVVDETANF